MDIGEAPLEGRWYQKGHLSQGVVAQTKITQTKITETKIALHKQTSNKKNKQKTKCEVKQQKLYGQLKNILWTKYTKQKYIVN